MREWGLGVMSLGMVRINKFFRKLLRTKEIKEN